MPRSYNSSNAGSHLTFVSDLPNVLSFLLCILISTDKRCVVLENYWGAFQLLRSVRCYRYRFQWGLHLVREADKPTGGECEGAITSSCTIVLLWSRRDRTLRYARHEYYGTNILRTTVQARGGDHSFVHVMCTRKRRLSPFYAAQRRMPLSSDYDGVFRIASMSSSTNCLVAPVFAI